VHYFIGTMKLLLVLLCFLLLPFSKIFSQRIDSALNIILNNRIQNFNLDEISNGYDSIQIRIWPNFLCNCRSLGLPQIIILKCNNNKWEGLIYKVSSPTNDYLTGDYDSLTFTPKYSWDTFMQSINLEDILKINNINDPTYIHTVIADGYIELIEIATKNNYKNIFFKQTNDYKNKYWQAKLFCNLKNKLESELNNK
jgi:hypothetical protein